MQKTAPSFTPHIQYPLFPHHIRFHITLEQNLALNVPCQKNSGSCLTVRPCFGNTEKTIINETNLKIIIKLPLSLLYGGGGGVKDGVSETSLLSVLCPAEFSAVTT